MPPLEYNHIVLLNMNSEPETQLCHSANRKVWLAKMLCVVMLLPVHGLCVCSWTQCSLLCLRVNMLSSSFQTHWLGSMLCCY